MLKNRSLYTPRSVALFLLLSLGALWGSGYSLAKLAMQYAVPPIGYAFWQSLGPAICLSLLCLSQKTAGILRIRNLQFYFIAGLLGITIPNTTMYFIAPHLPAGLLAVIVNTVPIITYPLALLFFQERFAGLRMLAVIVGFLGILGIILSPSSISNLEFSHWAWLALISPFSFALSALYINRYRPADISALTCATGMLIVSTLFLIPLTWATHSFYAFHWPMNFADKIILLEIILSSLGYVIFFILLKIAGPVYYSMVGGIVAIVGLGWGWIFFREIPSIWKAAAIGLILIAIALLSFNNKKY